MSPIFPFVHVTFDIKPVVSSLCIIMFLQQKGDMGFNALKKVMGHQFVRKVSFALLPHFTFLSLFPIFSPPPLLSFNLLFSLSHFFFCGIKGTIATLNCWIHLVRPADFLFRGNHPRPACLSRLKGCWGGSEVLRRQREKERVIKPNKSEGPFNRPGLLMRPAPPNAIPTNRRPHELQVERQMKENERVEHKWFCLSGCKLVDTSEWMLEP